MKTFGIQYIPASFHIFKAIFVEVAQGTTESKKEGMNGSFSRREQKRNISGNQIGSPCFEILSVKRKYSANMLPHAHRPLPMVPRNLRHKLSS